MSFKSLMLAAIAALFTTFGLALSAHAAPGIEVQEPYALPTLAGQSSGAAFMVIRNTGTAPDRLLDVRSDAADLVQLHTHSMDANGVMKMSQVKDGFDLPPGGELILQRGGNHVMMMGLHAPLALGQDITVTLVFELAGEVTVTVPVAESGIDAPMGGTGVAMPAN